MYNDDIRLIVFDNCKELGQLVNNEIAEIRNNNKDCIVPISEVRFSNGEGKIKINETCRSKDVYILSDVGNHSITYDMFGYKNHKSPDDHFQDIKRVMSALRGHASSVTVIMPLLYSSRQHRRHGRESLDCALALQELERLGVKSIISFDVHDPNIQNAIPYSCFENFYPTHTILSNIVDNEDVDFNNLLVISPDTGAMGRALYYADMLGVDVGVFYKRRDLSKVVDGKAPIVEHAYMGYDVAGKDTIVVDDMISSGESMLDVAHELRKRGARKIYLVATFALFTNGVKSFNKSYKNGDFTCLYSTNLSYIADEVKEQEWFRKIDCSSQVAKLIDRLNKHESITPLLNGKAELHKQLMDKKLKIAS